MNKKTDLDRRSILTVLSKFVFILFASLINFDYIYIIIKDLITPINFS